LAAKEKLSISFAPDVVARVREEAGEGHVSEWLEVAALLRLQATSLARLMESHGVKLSQKLLAEVEAEWPRSD
jgi:hypothetical protein